LAGYTVVSNATEVPVIMAPPIPCKTRQEISIVAEFASPQRKDESVKMTMPQAKIFLLPYISAILPKGTRRAAEHRR
jgi:hypothetical protein